MKTLILHYDGSYHKFENIYDKLQFEIKEDKILYIYLRDPTSGEELLHACFKKWDYFIIEEDL